MSYEYEGQSIGENAGVDLSSSRHRFVQVESGTGDVVSPSSAGDDCLGVLQNEPAQSETASVQLEGAPKVEATESITRSDDISVDADGKARTAQGGDTILGEALENAGGDGELLPVHLDRNGTA